MIPPTPTDDSRVGVERPGDVAVDDHQAGAIGRGAVGAVTIVDGAGGAAGEGDRDDLAGRVGPAGAVVLGHVDRERVGLGDAVGVVRVDRDVRVDVGLHRVITVTGIAVSLARELEAADRDAGRSVGVEDPWDVAVDHDEALPEGIRAGRVTVVVVDGAGGAAGEGDRDELAGDRIPAGAVVGLDENGERMRRRRPRWSRRLAMLIRASTYVFVASPLFGPSPSVSRSTVIPPTPTETAAWTVEDARHRAVHDDVAVAVGIRAVGAVAVIDGAGGPVGEGDRDDLARGVGPAGAVVLGHVDRERVGVVDLVGVVGLDRDVRVDVGLRRVLTVAARAIGLTREAEAADLNIRGGVDVEDARDVAVDRRRSTARGHPCRP